MIRLEKRNAAANKAGTIQKIVPGCYRVVITNTAPNEFECPKVYTIERIGRRFWVVYDSFKRNVIEGKTLLQSKEQLCRQEGIAQLTYKSP